MRSPGPLFRTLYQHVLAEANLPKLQPRPLPADQIVPGSAEFVLTQGAELEGGGWTGEGLIVPRSYIGYIAVHYGSDASQHETFDDEANIFCALLTFRQLPAVQSNRAFRGIGDAPSNWFLNTEPTKAGRLPVLTLAFDFSLRINLTIQEGNPL